MKGPAGTGMLTGVRSIFANSDSGAIVFTCALKTDATVWCWGSNSDGALGNNSTTDSLYPVQALV